MEIKKATQYFYSFSTLSFLLICAPSSAQEINPSTWYSFVMGSSNTILRDTFKLQTFMPTPSPDEWAYEVSANTALFNPLDEGISDAPDGYALKMMPDSWFDIRLASPEGHTNVYIQAIYAAWKLMPGEKLLATANRSSKPLNKLEVLSPPYNNYSRSFTEIKKESTGKVASIIITSSPYGLRLDVSKVSDHSEGFYALDSVYAYGDIPTFSLFTGTGLWDDPARWSHQPVFRHRKAFVNGHVTINNPVSCNRIYIGNGSLDILPGRKVDIHKLIICGEESSFSSSGEVRIKDSVTVYRTFPSKGRWYFISFPFDVYAEGISPGFKLMDKASNNGGDYFYLYTYNGNKRSLNNTAEGNWEVVPSEIPEGRPVFEKGKGYLFALDEKARTQTLSFSSATETLSSDFGKTGTLSIPVSTTGATPADKANQGWYLCGNPLPCPLPLKSILSEDLEEYIYVYNGHIYEAYALDEDYAIPPFSAFFVKAKKVTEIQLQIHSSAATKSINIIPMSAPLRAVKKEPRISGAVVSVASSPAIKQPNSYLNANSLFLENLPTPGAVYLWDTGGRLHWKKEINAGSSVIHLPLTIPSGHYIVRVDAKNYTRSHKFSWNPLFFK